jgi:hypothetical protein
MKKVAGFLMLMKLKIIDSFRPAASRLLVVLMLEHRLRLIIGGQKNAAHGRAFA